MEFLVMGMQNMRGANAEQRIARFTASTPEEAVSLIEDPNSVVQGIRVGLLDHKSLWQNVPFTREQDRLPHCL
jgi:hypothetical protein